MNQQFEIKYCSTAYFSACMPKNIVEIYADPVTDVRDSFTSDAAASIVWHSHRNKADINVSLISVWIGEMDG